MSSRPLVVELFGVAGAGKTTLVEALARAGGEFQAGIHLSRRETLPLYLRHLGSFLPTYLLHHRHTRWFSLGELRAMGYLRGWHRRLVHSPAGEGVLLLDHGPLFRLALLGDFGPPLAASPTFRRWWDETLARWAGTLDLLVWLDAPDEVLLPRIRTRAQAHVVKGASDPEALRFLAEYRAAYGRVVERLRELSPIPLLRFDTSASPPEELAAELAGAIRAVRSGTPPPPPASPGGEGRTPSRRATGAEA